MLMFSPLLKIDNPRKSNNLLSSPSSLVELIAQLEPSFLVVGHPEKMIHWQQNAKETRY